MKVDKAKLLQRKEVVEEINRHLWLESEKAGQDIGFEKAAEDWLTRFSSAWMEYHLPKERSTAEKVLSKRTNGSKTNGSKGKRRSAKSYH